MDELKQIIATIQELNQSVLNLQEVKTEFGIFKEKFNNFEDRIKKLEDGQENSCKDIQNMVITMNNLSNKLDNTNKTLDSTNESVDKLLLKLNKAEEEPRKFNKAIKQQVIITAITVSFSMFMTFIIGLFVYYIKIK